MEARLSLAQHKRYPWRIDEIAPDFELIDAWALPAEGSLDDFDRLCRIFANLDLTTDENSRISNGLGAVRQWLGDLFGWDEQSNSLPIPGSDEVSLRERLPNDLEPETGETVPGSPFRPVYRTSDEWALEVSNSTVHAVFHLGWVPRANDRYSGQLGVYVKPRGRLGRPYMAAIAPFRHYVIYPALMRRIGSAWNATD